MFLFQTVVLILNGITDDLLFLLDDVRLDLPLLALEVDGLELLVTKLIENIGVLLENAVGVLAQAHLSRDTLGLYLLGDHNSRAENVIPDDLGSNDTSNDWASMDASSQVQILNLLDVTKLALDIINDVYHLHGSPDNPLGLFDESSQPAILFLPLLLAIVAHNEVHVADQVDLVDLVLDADLVQPLNELLLEIDGLAHLVEADSDSLV